MTQTITSKHETRRSGSKRLGRRKRASATAARRGSGGNVFTRGAVKPTSVAKVRQSLGVKQQEFARMAGYSVRAVADWESGKAIGQSARQRVNELQRLAGGLAGVMDEHHIGEWLQTPNEAFGGHTPLQVIERGEIDRLWRMIFQFEAGVAE
jgi:DNA-binding transcriptional regulator YiaG